MGGLFFGLAHQLSSVYYAAREFLVVVLSPAVRLLLRVDSSRADLCFAFAPRMQAVRLCSMMVEVVL